MGQVIVSRQLPNHQVAFANFLLDAYCLGVKNALFEIVSSVRYETNILPDLKARFSLERIDPSFARKLVEGGVEYAQSLGFAPHPDYNKARLIFGDIDASASEEDFSYGNDGKPLFIAGPYDGPEKSARILHALHERCGADGFHYVLPGNVFGSAPAARLLERLEDPQKS